VLCGSEDATVSLWHREKGEIITKITGGHTQTINSVSWCPTDPQLFVTASDDHTLRLWGTETMPSCEIIADTKDIKRIDVLKTGTTGSRTYIGL
jgi:WD40 repeat protein